MNIRLRAAFALALLLAFAASPKAEASPTAPSASMPSFEKWLDAIPARRAEVEAFEAFLAREGVAGVLPTSEILISDTDWSLCKMEAPYALAGKDQWPHIVNTLRYLRDEVVPLIGPVQVVSGYRDLRLNTCVDGARHSAHAQFYALDLAPVRAIARSELIARMCANHARHGASYRAGLGIYGGTKFHIDTRAFRRWGADYRGGSSPCIRYEASLKRKKKSPAKTMIARKDSAIPRLRLAMISE